ncbi:MAG: hypothetical protein H0W86_13185 [Armatimonadetes bacterium]|nr:hypothetical protein [Armatimonadota bacterium]
MRHENDDNRKEAQGVESPDGEFRVNSGRVIRCLVISSVLCLASLAIIVVGFVVAFPEPVINKRVITILLGRCVLVLVLLMFASNWKKYGQRVVVLAEGFRFHKGEWWSEVLWEDITAVWRHSSTIEGSLALLETDLWIQVKDRETIYLTSFFLDMERLVDIVLAETARRMVPAMLSQLRNGQIVGFGKVAISATELVASGKALAWGDVHAIQVAHGGIDVQRRGVQGSWYYTPIKKMPNYHVFLALPEVLLKADGTQSQEKGTF